VALRLDIVDMPAARKVHTDPIPYLGGLAIILAFVAAMVLGVVVHPLAGSYKQVAAILGGGLVLAGMGLVDDLKVVPGWIKVPSRSPRDWASTRRAWPPTRSRTSCSTFP